MLRRVVLTLALCLAAWSANATPVTINVANAPAWQQSTSYTGPIGGAFFGSRVVAGPGFTAPSTYTNGSALYLWAAINTTAGTSAASGNGPQSCPTPGTSTATDGTVTWRCLTKVDYITMTSALLDDPVAWVPSVGWDIYQIITNAGNVYQEVFGYVYNANPICTGATVGPTGTGANIPDGSCLWTFLASIPYTSAANRWPHQLYVNSSPGCGCGLIQIDYNVTVVVWDGGTAAPEYVGGVGNEQNPITTTLHQAAPGDNGPRCKDNPSQYFPNCIGGYQPGYTVTIKAAPGDGICDHGGVALGYNPANGVAFHNTAASGNNFGFYEGDGGLVVHCLQFKSNSGVALWGDPIGGVHTDFGVVTGNIIDSGSQYGTTADYGFYFADNLIIARGNAASGCGICTKYQHIDNNNTIIATNAGANATCIAMQDVGYGAYPGFAAGAFPVVQDQCYGWAHFFASDQGEGGVFTPSYSSNNATDLPPTDSGVPFAPPSIIAGPNNFTPIAPITVSSTACGGPCYSLTPSAVFVNAASDWRLSSASPVRGAGAAYSKNGGTWQDPYNNAVDIEGTARPQGTAFDIGAFQYPLSGAPPLVGPGRMFIK